MKLCFPIEVNNGIESIVYGHFGSAPMFLIYETGTNATAIIDNQNLGHAHGMCSPIQALDGKSVDAIVVGGIGAGAINKLNMMGIKVYRAIEDTIQKNIDLFNNQSIPEITLDHACNQHGGCDH
jgi:predicted Fe-Mo cluster-binding NifX family protein